MHIWFPFTKFSINWEILNWEAVSWNSPLVGPISLSVLLRLCILNMAEKSSYPFWNKIWELLKTRESNYEEKTHIPKDNNGAPFRVQISEPSDTCAEVELRSSPAGQWALPFSPHLLWLPVHLPRRDAWQGPAFASAAVWLRLWALHYFPNKASLEPHLRILWSEPIP